MMRFAALYPSYGRSGHAATARAGRGPSGVRPGFHPEFDRFAAFASLDQPEILEAGLLTALPGQRIEPRVRLRRPYLQKCCKLGIGTWWSPNHPKLDANHQIGKTGRYNAART
jgi:hypothetical protein